MNPSGKKYKRHTITAALPYANGPLHIGHLAGAYLPADIYVRYLRSKGEDVAFICGTDEHGAAITIKALNEGTTPQAIVDKYYEMIRDSFEKFNISFDIFSRTSKPIHHETAQAFFLKFYNEGKFVEKEIEQLYDAQAGMFLADRYVKGTCPRCSNPAAYGDQCEKCGSSLSPTDLIDPVSAVSGTKPELKKTKNWYLPLDQYQERMEKFIVQDHDYWKVNVFGQCKSWLNDGLQARAITRDIDWGVKVPLPGAENKVLYVWFDAPIGYISATKEWAQQHGKDWEQYWKDPETELIHFIGKDNIVFHCIIFPAMLMGHGEFILPENVPANEFLNLENEKISTSRNWAVWLHEYAENFPGMTDALRYVLCATMPETKDNNFTWDDFQQRNNSELVAILGNFVNRVMVLTEKFFEGKVPPRGPLTEIDDALMKSADQILLNLGGSIENFRFREALGEMMNLARAGNKYLADTEPWKLAKTDLERTGTILNLSLQLCARLTAATEPFLPETAVKIAGQLNIAPLRWTDLWKDEFIQQGHALGKSALLFSQIAPEAIEPEKERLRLIKEKIIAAQLASEEVKAVPVKPHTTFDDFQKMDLRTGTILHAEPVPKADKLLKLEVDLGFEKRTILSGVAEHYKAEELVGRKCLVLVNLPPRKIRGIESNGMLLFAEDAKGRLRLMGPLDETENGSTVN